MEIMLRRHIITFAEDLMSAINLMAVAIPNAVITSIERVEDSKLYERYYEIRASIAYARGGNPNERYLWYMQAHGAALLSSNTASNCVVKRPNLVTQCAFTKQTRARDTHITTLLMRHTSELPHACGARIKQVLLRERRGP